MKIIESFIVVEYSTFSNRPHYRMVHRVICGSYFVERDNEIYPISEEKFGVMVENINDLLQKTMKSKKMNLYRSKFGRHFNFS